MRVRTLGIRLELPGAAGEYQRTDDFDALVAELGDNYSLYHAFLARELGRVGDTTPTRGLGGAWVENKGREQDILMAEAALRTCRRHRKEGRPLRDGAPPEAPLLDAQRRLVSAERVEDLSVQAPPWSPPPEPDWERLRTEWRDRLEG